MEKCRGFALDLERLRQKDTEAEQAHGGSLVVVLTWLAALWH